MTYSKRIIYYATKKQIKSQPSCILYKVSCLLDKGVEPWYIEDSELLLALKNNEISVYDTPPIDISGADYSVIECDINKTNIADFYTYNEVSIPTDKIVWRTFIFFYDNDLKHPLFGKFSNILKLEPFFRSLVAVS